MQKSKFNYKENNIRTIYYGGKLLTVRDKKGNLVKVHQNSKIILKHASKEQLAHSRRILYAHDKTSRKRLKLAKEEHKAYLVENGINPKTNLNVPY